ncbi:IS630 family transposase [Hymenobacter canadensis]|uniref:IS630 family transposase n=1 Tax=Hymenobacter canadensis TaxID=2999067 RepID=A0ABY7LXI4_9BACT|nr:IS630 family transposase [Hymenobacter canadensis]WBA43845.1 IS630 family transposase [Hymenobacter canadensis]WBA44236.1 IS630 family transposase [Hymenobacter canadensis]
MSQLDGEYLAKLEDVLELYAQPAHPGRARLCFDERPCQLLGDKLAALPARPGQVAKQDHEYVRHGTAVVLLAYDLDTGQRYAQVRARRTKADYADFVHHVLTTHYADVPRVDLVQDNLNTHAYGSFYAHLPAAQARALSRQVGFHFTPKHGSWLNMAELEFSALARQCLDRRIASLYELTQQVQAWATERNRRAVKVNWSFTVAKAEDKLQHWYEKVNPVNKPEPPLQTG